MSTVQENNQIALPGSIEFSERRILIGGAPRLVFAAEVHYFRLAKEDWANRLQLLQNNGMDTVATYIPWVWHELPNGEIDLEGRTHPQRDLLSFLDLCASRGLNIIVRPGPFCMAELRNEGLPYRLYGPPFVQPVTWMGAPIKTRTRDYLAPDYLDAVRGWYGAVMPVIASRLKSRGGSIIAVQLDNEIGMLQWVSNCPDLSDDSCEDMRDWSVRRYGVAVATSRIGADASAPVAWAAALRAPNGDALSLHHDLGLYMRDRFRRYVQILRDCAESHGISGVPFLINIHGTGGGRGLAFPIGISQLFETYRDQPQMTSGSDLYLGDLTVSNVADLYLANAFMQAMHDRDQPLTSLEFEVGNGNYGDDLGQLYTPEAAELKARLCVAQGNRLLNFYIHCGGENPLMTVGDRTERIAFTGQRHGFAAPVGPEGQLGSNYEALSRLTKTLRGLEHLLADARQECDDFAIGFVPDHYMTEYRSEGSSARREQIADLERFRGRGPRDVLARALLLCGFSFPAVNLQAEMPLTGALVLATGNTLSRDVQERIVSYVRNGGRLLLVGALPFLDHDGAECSVLKDAIGLISAGQVDENAEPSVRSHGWAAPRPDVRVTFVQLLRARDPSDKVEPLLTHVGTGMPCAARVKLGEGEVTVLGCDYPADLSFYSELMASLNVVPRFELDADGPGIVVTSTRSRQGRQLLHLINVAPQPVALSLRKDGNRFLNGQRLIVPARTAFALPFSYSRGQALVDARAGASIVHSTAELMHETQLSFTIRPTQKRDVIVLRTRRKVECKFGIISRTGTTVRIVIDRAQHNNKPVTIKLTRRLRDAS